MTWLTFEAWNKIETTWKFISKLFKNVNLSSLQLRSACSEECFQVHDWTHEFDVAIKAADSSALAAVTAMRKLEPRPWSLLLEQVRAHRI